MLEVASGWRKGELVILSGSSHSRASMFKDSRSSAAIPPSGDEYTLNKYMSVYAIEITVRQHKRKRNQTEAYHKKVQKRWDKRSKKETKFQVISQPKVFNMPRALYDGIELLQGDKHV